MYHIMSIFLKYTAQCVKHRGYAWNDHIVTIIIIIIMLLALVVHYSRIRRAGAVWHSSHRHATGVKKYGINCHSNVLYTYMVTIVNIYAMPELRTPDVYIDVYIIIIRAGTARTIRHAGLCAHEHGVHSSVSRSDETTSPNATLNARAVHYE